MRQVKIIACSKHGGNIDWGIFPLAYFSVFLVVIRSSFSWHIFYLYSHSVGNALEKNDRLNKSWWDEMRLRKRVRSSFSKGVSLRATRTDRTETTSTENSVSMRHRHHISESRVMSSQDHRPEAAQKYLSALTWDTNDKGLQGQITPLDSKFDRDASTHQRKKVQNQKNFLGGHNKTKTFCLRWPNL